MASIRTRKLAILITLSVCSCASAADWPTWRYDGQRTAFSPALLPPTLHLQWSRELGKCAVAWPLEPRLQFDPCYEPVAASQLLFIASPNDGSVQALDTRSGNVQWKFYTDGPVRFAPVAWQEKLYVGSDDGYVYCLATQTGSLLWKFRAAPPERPDLRHLGNNRMISAWPVRGGPVIRDGVLYCGSGVWATMGAFVYALNALTGDILWSNDHLNFLTNIRTDHNRIADSAVAPQGYFVLAGKRLLIPNGRSMPVGLDTETGKLLYAIQGYRNGHCRVTTDGKVVYVGPNGALSVETGRELGERWHESDAETPKEYSKRIDLFEAPHLPYKFVPGCDAWSVLGDGVVYGGASGIFYAHDVAHAVRTTYERKNGLKPGKWDVPELWRLSTGKEKGKPLTRMMICAGNTAYGHVGETIVAVRLPENGNPAKIVWQEDVPGTPATMIAADDKLFVVTQQGDILCFGAETIDLVSHSLTVSPLPDSEDVSSLRATKLLEQTEAHDGYCLVLGVVRGRLIQELLRQSELKIIAVDSDKQRINELREKLSATGHYGNRVEALVGDPGTVCLPPYFASLIVSESLNAARLASKVAATQLVRWLRPYGGTASIQLAEGNRLKIDEWLRQGDLENTHVSCGKGAVVLERVGELPGSAHWTHECADSARTYFSHDDRVKAPLGVLWYGDGPDHGFKKRKDYHAGVKPQVVNGILVAFEDRAARLRAYDVYTGRVLWDVPADPFTRYASMPDGIYSGAKDAVVVHDPASGSELRRLPYPLETVGAEALFVADLRVAGGTVVVASAFKKVRNIPKGLYNSDVLFGLDKSSGKTLWNLRAENRFNHHGLAVSPDRVFVVDSPSADNVAAAQRRGNAPETLDSTVIAMDSRTGAVVWKQVFANLFLSYHDSSYPQGSIQSLDDALFYSAACNVLIVYKDRRYRGVDANSGDVLWEIAKGAAQPIMVEGKTFLSQGGGLFDVRTGKSLPSKARVRGGNGCNHAVAGKHFIFRRTFTAACFDVHDGEAYYMRSARSGCTNNLIAADGVLSVPCFSVGCVCNHPLETSFCLVHMPGTRPWAGTEPLREPLPLGERDPEKWRK